MKLCLPPATLAWPVLLLSGIRAVPGAPLGLPFRPAAVPGGVAVVPLPSQAEGIPVTYRGTRVLVRRTERGWVAVVGLPLSTRPGTEALDAGGRRVPFTVRAKRYPEQRLRLANPRLVTPDPEDEARIAREQARIAPAWKAWPEGQVPSLAFQTPTPGDLTSSFGLRRIFNGQPRAPHGGLDIRAAEGAPVRAPASGVVVLTGDFFFSGKAVFLAHGEGVVSLFAHLSQVAVQEGQEVKRGDLLGRVGHTGRATGPHLHWSLSLNDARVDPRLFLEGAP